MQLRDYGTAEVATPGVGLLAALVDLTWPIDRDEVVIAYAISKLSAIDDEPRE